VAAAVWAAARATSGRFEPSEAVQAELVAALRATNSRLCRDAQDTRVQLDLAVHENQLLRSRSRLGSFAVRHPTGVSTGRKISQLAQAAAGCAFGADEGGEQAEAETEAEAVSDAEAEARPTAPLTKAPLTKAVLAADRSGEKENAARQAPPHARRGRGLAAAAVQQL